MNLMIGDSAAEKIKKEIGTAIPSSNNTFLMKGEISDQELKRNRAYRKRCMYRSLAQF